MPKRKRRGRHRLPKHPSKHLSQRRAERAYQSKYCSWYQIRDVDNWIGYQLRSYNKSPHIKKLKSIALWATRRQEMVEKRATKKKQSVKRNHLTKETVAKVVEDSVSVNGEKYDLGFLWEKVEHLRSGGDDLVFTLMATGKVAGASHVVTNVLDLKDGFSLVMNKTPRKA